MPQFTQLGYNCSVLLEALDPSSGAAVDGVVVSAIDIYADVVEGGTGPGGTFALGSPILLGVNA